MLNHKGKEGQGEKHKFIRLRQKIKLIVVGLDVFFVSPLYSGKAICHAGYHPI